MILTTAVTANTFILDRGMPIIFVISGRFYLYRWGGRGHNLLLALSQKILLFLKQALVVVSTPYALYKIFKGGVMHLLFYTIMGNNINGLDHCILK